MPRLDLNEIFSSFGRAGRRSGPRTFYHCPFHSEENPSFVVWDDSPEWGHCFGCGRNAHAVSVYAALAGVSYAEAARRLGVEGSGAEESLRARSADSLKRRLRRLERTFQRTVEQIPEVKRFLREKAPYLLEFSRLANFSFYPFVVAGEAEEVRRALEDLVPWENRVRYVLRTLSGRLCFPLLEVSDGWLRLWGFVGRAIPGLVPERALEEKKYVSVTIYEGRSRPTKPLFLAHLPPSGGKLFLVEGVTDALAARRWQIPAVAAAGAIGANVVAPLARYLRTHPVSRVVLVPDPDFGGRSAVCQAARKLSREFSDLAIEVLELPEGTDLDEFLMNGGNVRDLPVRPLFEYLAEVASRTESRRTLRESDLAASAEEVILKEASLEDLYSFLEGKPKREREKYLARAAELRGVNQGDLLRDLTSVAMDRFFQKSDEDEIFLHPVVDYHHRRRIASLGFSAKFTVLGEPTLANFFVYSVETEDGIGIYRTDSSEVQLSDGTRVFFEAPKYMLPDINEVWSARGLGDLISRASRGDESLFDDYSPAQVFRRLRNLVQKYLYLESPLHYDVLVAYIMLTYFHQVFWSLPFLFLYGNKGSGKSRAMKLLHHLCFNAVLLERGTSAAFCDLFDRRGTGLIDQAETLAYTKNLDVVSMLASSYTKETGKRYVVEIVRGQRHQRRFDLYGPKVIASFREPLYDLKDRLIVIPFVKAPARANYPDPTSEAEDWRFFRGLLYGMYLLYASTVAEHYEHTLRRGRFVGRSAEIFVPLAVVLEVAGVAPSKINAIFEFFEEMIREISPLIYDRDVQVLEALLEVLSRRFTSHEAPVEVHIAEVLASLRETGWEGEARSLRSYVEEIIRRNRACLRTLGGGRFYTTVALVEKALDRLRESGGGETREDRNELPSPENLQMEPHVQRLLI